MEIRKLLYVTDLEKPDFSDIERLIVLQKLGLEEVIFLEVDGIEGWEKRVADFGLKSRTLPTESPPLPRILDLARKEAASMIAANLERAARKSRTKNLLRSSPVPVMVFNRDLLTSGSVEKGVFHHVIFATDWSPVSERALKVLLDFKGIIEMLEIVNVINKKLSVRDMRELKQKLVETRKTFLDMGVDAESHVYAGKPHEEIMLAARDYDATSIIMGTSCKSPLREFFSRSCSYRIAEEATVPALFVPLPVKLD